MEKEKVFLESDLPESRLKDVSGSITLDEQHPRIAPISSFHCDDVVNFSKNAFLLHHRQTKHAKTIMQVFRVVRKLHVYTSNFESKVMFVHSN